LPQLARRHTGTAETVRNPLVRADLHHAAGAVSDLASIKFGIEEIAESIHGGATTEELRQIIGRE
jgi:hypothetical protein